MLFEYKFGRARRPFPSHHVQAQTYGIMLSKIGFNTERPLYALVMADPKAKENKDFQKNVFKTIIKSGIKEGIFEIEDAVIHTYRFDYERAEKNLKWAIEFWTRKRDAIPTKNPKKCVNCEYYFKCRNIQFQNMS